MNGFSCDAAVIGAGAAGMAAALSLHERGKSVMLIDREEAMGGSSSSASTTASAFSISERS
ncbi:FAD-dependent oxidoreductase [Treponema zuelzerae]|uniref:FAD-dependent oxidoreductase n=1 Tax=Teretinema zuelzerae TaxID=156 RepID=A0AAE3EL70_9SPIR|nr:FAD-dependent oxidoreductase [Teretinema zuelzerae]MCD1655414.1 FAD-dependent oxidoreductase [Teretinema zuelzerae]